jgi:hypothetical protein
MIKYLIIDPTGFSYYEQPAEQALSEIKQYIKKTSGWLYINGCYTNIDDLTVDVLLSASKIAVTNIIFKG